MTKIGSLVSSLFSEGAIGRFIGFKKGWDVLRPVPAVISRKEDAPSLILDPFCGSNLSKYLVEEVDSSDGAKVGILARGCDSLGILRLIYDRRIPRESIFIVGASCAGALDPEKVRRKIGRVDPKASGVAADIEGEQVALRGPWGEAVLPKKDLLYDKCLECENPSPLVYDLALDGEQKLRPSTPVGAKDYSKVEEIESLSPDQRYSFWSKELSRCLRCFACRQACPACSCRKCSLDDPTWLEKPVTLSEQFSFHFQRAYHVAGRCTGCGECDRVCPVGIPISLLTKKLARDISSLFGVDPYIPSEVEPLGKFQASDPEGWAKR